jgi:hypothetical protein
MKMIKEAQALAKQSRVQAKENWVQIKALAASQRETDRMLKGLMQSLERRGNSPSRADIR